MAGVLAKRNRDDWRSDVRNAVFARAQLPQSALNARNSLRPMPNLAPEVAFVLDGASRLHPMPARITRQRMEPRPLARTSTMTVPPQQHQAYRAHPAPAREPRTAPPQQHQAPATSCYSPATSAHCNMCDTQSTFEI
jgi:hypothetical protein